MSTNFSGSSILDGFWDAPDETDTDAGSPNFDSTFDAASILDEGWDPTPPEPEQVKETSGYSLPKSQTFDVSADLAKYRAELDRQEAEAAKPKPRDEQSMTERATGFINDAIKRSQPMVDEEGKPTGFASIRRGVDNLLASFNTMMMNARARQGENLSYEQELEFQKKQEDYRRAAAKYQAEADAIPQNEVAKKLSTSSLGEAFTLLVSEPVKVLTEGIPHLVLESSPYLAAGATAGALAGPIAGAFAVALTTVAGEGGGEQLDWLAKKGVNITDPEAVRKALKDKALVSELNKRGFTKGGVIAAVDAVTFKLGSMVSSTGLSPVRKAITDVMLDTIGGPGGEAASQLAARGKINEPGAITAELFGGIGPAVVGGTVEAATGGHHAAPVVEQRSAPSAGEVGGANTQAANFGTQGQQPGIEAQGQSVIDHALDAADSNGLVEVDKLPSMIQERVRTDLQRDIVPGNLAVGDRIPRASVEAMLQQDAMDNQPAPGRAVGDRGTTTGGLDLDAAAEDLMSAQTPEELTQKMQDVLAIPDSTTAPTGGFMQEATAAPESAPETLGASEVARQQTTPQEGSQTVTESSPEAVVEKVQRANPGDIAELSRIANEALDAAPAESKTFTTRQAAVDYAEANSLDLDTHSVQPVKGGYTIAPRRSVGRQSAVAQPRPEPAAEAGNFESTAAPKGPGRRAYHVVTEDNGRQTVSVVRHEDGSASLVEHGRTGTEPTEYSARFAEGKTDEQLLRFANEPFGIESVTPRKEKPKKVEVRVDSTYDTAPEARRAAEKANAKAIANGDKVVFQHRKYGDRYALIEAPHEAVGRLPEAGSELTLGELGDYGTDVEPEPAKVAPRLNNPETDLSSVHNGERKRSKVKPLKKGDEISVYGRPGEVLAATDLEGGKQAIHAKVGEQQYVVVRDKVTGDTEVGTDRPVNGIGDAAAVNAERKFAEHHARRQGARREAKVAPAEDVSAKLVTNNRKLPGKKGSVSAQAVDARLNQFRRSWKGIKGLELEVVPNEDQLPPELKAWLAKVREKQPHANARALFVHGERRSSGTIYFVADQFRSLNDVGVTAIHELAGHASLRDIFGSKFDNLLDDVYTHHRELVNERARSYGYDTSTEAGRRKAAEEVLANLQETAEDQKIWERVVQAIRDIVRDLGWKLDLSEGDIKAILQAARTNIEHGLSPTQKATARRYFAQSSETGTHGTAADLTAPSEQTEVPAGPMSLADAADQLGVSEATLQSLVDDGVVSPIPGTNSFDREAIDGLERSLAGAGEAATGLSASEVQAQLGVSPGELQELVARGELTPIGPEGDRRFTPSQVRRVETVNRAVTPAADTYVDLHRVPDELALRLANKIDAVQGFFANHDPAKHGGMQRPIVVGTSMDLPFSAPPGTRGAAWQGDVYLVADAIKTKAEAYDVAAHEFVGHLKAEATPGFSAAIESIIKEHDQLGNVKKIWQEQAANIEAQGRPVEDSEVAREVIAVLAERESHHGTIRRIVNAWRTLLVKLGAVNPKEAAIYALIHKAYSGTNVTYDNTPWYSVSPSPAAVQGRMTRTMIGIANRSKAGNELCENIMRRAYGMQLNFQDDTAPLGVFEADVGNDTNIRREVLLGRAKVSKSQENLEVAGAELADQMEIAFPRLNLDDRTEKVQEYLHARHASEANASLRRRNLRRMQEAGVIPEGIDVTDLTLSQAKRYVDGSNSQFWKDMWERPSGMSDRDASRILSEYERGDEVVNRAMKRMGEVADLISKYKLSLLEESGLISSDMRKRLDRYRHYVPLQREVESPNPVIGGRTAKRFFKPVNVRGGSLKPVANMVENMFRGASEAIEQSRRNIEAQLLLTAVDKYDQGGNWFAVNTTRETPVIDASGQLRMQKRPIYSPDASITFFVNGQRVSLVANPQNSVAIDLVRGWNNPGASMNVVMRTIAKITRLMTKAMTTFNPNFIAGNMFRDVHAAMLNLTPDDIGTGTTSAANRAKIVKNAGSTLRAMAPFGGVFKDSDTQFGGNQHLSDQWELFKSSGAQITWVDSLGGSKDSFKALAIRRKNVFKRTIQNPFHTADQFFRYASEMTESATRFGVFSTVMDHHIANGIDHNEAVKRAAMASREASTDFMRRGMVGGSVNSIYAFFNASIQSTAKSLNTLYRFPVRKALGAATMIGMYTLMDMMARSMSGDDDDDGIKNYDEPRMEGSKVRSMLIPVGDGNNGERYLALPLPWFWNVYSVAGRSIGESISQAFGAQMPPDKATHPLAGNMVYKTVARIGSVLNQSVNPFYAETWLQTASPTILDPLTQIWENKAWHGGALIPEGNKWENEMLWKRRKASTPEAYTFFADLIHGLGGTDTSPGYAASFGLEVLENPEVLRNLIQGYQLGVGGIRAPFVESLSVFSDSFLDESEGGVNWKKAPGVGRFVVDQIPGGDYDKAKAIESQVKAVEEGRIDNPALADWAPTYKRDVKALKSKHRKASKYAREGNQSMADYYNEQVDEIQNRIFKEYNSLNK